MPLPTDPLATSVAALSNPPISHLCPTTPATLHLLPHRSCRSPGHRQRKPAHCPPQQRLQLSTRLEILSQKWRVLPSVQGLCDCKQGGGYFFPYTECYRWIYRRKKATTTSCAHEMHGSYGQSFLNRVRGVGRTVEFQPHLATPRSNLQFKLQLPWAGTLFMIPTTPDEWTEKSA
jgi:hypothetical protein